MSGGILATLIAAIIGAAAGIWSTFIQSRRDMKRMEIILDNLKEMTLERVSNKTESIIKNTDDMQPRVANIEKHTDKIEEITRQIEKTQEIEKAKSKNLPSMQSVIAEISALYTKNVELAKQNIEQAQTVNNLTKRLSDIERQLSKEIEEKEQYKNNFEKQAYEYSALSIKNSNLEAENEQLRRNARAQKIKKELNRDYDISEYR